MNKKMEKSPIRLSKTQAADLAVVIARMQKNADQVEKNILLTEELLALEAEREKKKQPLIHQKENADNLAEAEGLIKDLFLDVDKAKRLQHPQTSEIEKDVSNLHDRWVKNCAIYRDMYDPVQEVDLTPRIDWAALLNDKQRQIKAEEYGPSLSHVEKQMAAHNILHQEIEAYNSQLDPTNVPSQEQYAVIRAEYTKLLESSRLRHQSLTSLYEYMHSCSKELGYLSEQQEKILRRDWSDRMLDPSSVRIAYEKFKNTGLLAHESEANKLQEQGERLIELKHPGSPAIQVYRDAVQDEWQCFLNLCIAQETHLDNIEDYKKFQLDAETLSESLERLKSAVDPRFLAQKSNPEVLMALEGDKPAVERNEQRLAALKEVSHTIPPLKLRQIKPTKPTDVVSLCDWTDREDLVRRGDRLTLKSNSDNKNWEVQSRNGKILTLPGACFIIPPPDEEALEKVDSLDRELADLKRRRSALIASLRSPSIEVVHPQKAVAVASAPDDPNAIELAGQMDKIRKDLDQSERGILGRMRDPLDRRNPTHDLANRLKEHEVAVQTLRNLEAEKSSVQRQMEPILTKKPLGPTASSLPLKLSTVNNKFEDLNTLAELYNKKATSSMFLERQTQKVEGIVSSFEEQLMRDGAILDTPTALPTRIQQLQTMAKEVASKQDEIYKLGRDLEMTEQACSPLQKGFQEYCQDISHQRTEVKNLRNRYTNVSNQLQERLTLIQEAANKNQGFQGDAQSLHFFLLNLPDNKIKPTDGVAQITTKQNSQKRVVEDIKRKSDDLKRVKDLSHDLQKVLHEYEVQSNRYSGTLKDDDDDDDDDEDGLEAKKHHTSTMAYAVQKKERDIQNLYSEVTAENDHLLSQMGMAKSIMANNEARVSQVVVKQQLQHQSQQRSLVETDGLKKELSEEASRRLHAENDLNLYRKRFMSLKSRRGVERVEEKEVVQYYRDPKLEAELESLKNKIKDESVKRSSKRSELELINEKIVKLETELSRIEPKLVTKVLTEYERDPQLDKEADRIREEMRRLRQELQTRDTETVHMKTEITVLAQKKPRIMEKVVKKEVVRLEKDPEMLKAVLTFQNEILDEESRCKSLNDDIFSIRSQINTLERLIPTIQPKMVTKVLKKVEQDPDLLRESTKLHLTLEEEKDENVLLMKDLTTLQLCYGEVEKLKPKVEVKEIINEIYRVDPETEVELVRLKKELQDRGRNHANVKKELSVVLTELNTLRSQKPKVEYKEVTQEVVREEKSPEVVRELQRLNHQVSRLQVNVDSTWELLNRLRKERDELKVEKSKVETKLVTKELVRYENDPLLDKEADRLRRAMREEVHQRRSLEEAVFDLQNKYLTLERQKPEEKIIKQEVVRVEKDPKQMLEHERLNKTLDQELKSRRKLELEVRQLRGLVEEKESRLAQMDDRQRRIQVETELRQIKSRILELESAPAPVEENIIIEELLKVERDPKLEKLTGDLRVNMEAENNNISRLQKEIINLKMKLEILQREKTTEKVIYKEIIRVEKDPAVEAERDHLRELVTQERNLRRNQEDDVQSLNAKSSRLQMTLSTSSQEETALTLNCNALQREKENLLKELQTLESERQKISVSFQQQSKLMSERNQSSRQRSLKLGSDVQRLERDILKEKDAIHNKEILIAELQSKLYKEEHSETHTRETNVSTKITILDPETGKDLSPYDAYLQGLIDRNQYIRLQELECNWEEISSKGPDGETSVLQDRKSGKQFPIKDALRDGRLTQYDYQLYKSGKMPISEFALLVAGETKKPYPSLTKTPLSPTRANATSPLNSMPTSLRASYPSLSTYNNGSLNKTYNSGSLTSLNTSASDELFPISGIYDTTTQSRMSVRSALTRKLIDTDTALKLLEAQAASGGIVDLNKKDKLSVHNAAEHGLIDKSHMHKLLNAQKAFTGVEDPVTKERLSLGRAAEKGWISRDSAMRYMEVQCLTGGLVNPSKVGRLSITDALNSKMIDGATAESLQDESSYAKELVDPITKEKMSYKQAMDRSTKDISTGLLLLPAASTDASNAPSSKYWVSSVQTAV